MNSNARLLIIKSAPAHAGQFKHTGKYALYGNPPRWHLLHADKPAPKSAPIASVPHVAGQHLPATLSTDEVEALKYPADKAAANHEMKNWNEKHLPELLGHAANGDATAILGMTYGSNTHGKIKAKLANMLLEKMGSKHVVKPGQKAGEHEAVQGAAPAPVEQPQPAADAGPKEGDTKEGADGQLVFKEGRWHKQEAAAPADKPAAPALDIPAFDGGTIGQSVIDYYQPIAQKVIDLAAAEDVAGLEAMKEKGLQPNSKGKIGNTWKGKTPNSKLLLALHAEAMKVAGKGAAIAHLEQDQKQAGIPAEEKAEDKQTVARLKEMKPAEAVDAALDHLKGDEGQDNLPAAEHAEDKALVGELEAAQSAKPHEIDLADYKTAAWAPTLSSKAFKGDNPAWYSQSSGTDIQVHGTMTFEGHGPGEHAKKTLAEYKAAKAAGYQLQNFKTSGLQHAYVFVKNDKILTKEGMAALVAGADAKQTPSDATDSASGSDSGVIAPKGGNLSSKYWISDKGAAKYQAQKSFGVFSADGKKALGKNGQPSAWGALYTVKEIAPHADKMVADGTHEWIDVYDSLAEAEAAHKASAPAKKEPRLVIPKKPREAAPAPTVAAPATSKLDHIPWDAQLLPADNKNAKSHNKQVEKIKAMALAGDIAGLEAFKAGSNTYGKKQNLLAQTALAALKEGGAPAESAPSPAAAVDPTSITPDDEYNLLNWVKMGKPSKGTSSAKMQAIWDGLYQSQKDYLDKKAGVPSTQPQSLAGKPAYDHLAHELKNGGFADEAAKEWMAANPGAWDELNEALNDHGYGHLATFGPAVAGFDASPKEGDVKQGADGMLVLKDGHWVKVNDDSALEKNKAQLEKWAAEGKWQILEDVKTFSDTTQAEKDYIEQLQSAKPATIKKLSASEVASMGKVFKTAAGNKAKIKAFAVAGDMEGLKNFIATVGPKMPASKKLAEAVLAAMEAAPEVPVGAPKKTKPKAAPQPTPTQADPNAIEAMDNWTQTGQQGGSNPGGRFKDESGQEWYCKFPADEDMAKAEVLASKLYAALGISGQDAKLITKGGKVGIASKWTSVSKAPSPAALAKTEGVASGFGADAWLGNWDVVGMGFDNLQVGADGKAHRVDAGGSLMYRAQGGKKAFGNVVSEIDSLRDPKINPQASAVFGGLTDADITASVAKVLAVSDFTIATLVHKFGPGSAADKQALIETLVARKADLAAKFPAASKKKVPKFKPEEISAPPDFMNWGGSGKSGPSSKPFLNEANHKAAQNIFDAAKSGDPKAVQVLTAPIYNKDTGEITGSAPVLDHPSQHIKGYAQQVINEINYQLNPPKKFRFDGGHPLHALNAAYPAYKGALQSQTVAKVAKFINLGEPGQITLDSLGLKKKTYQSGTLSQQTYKKQAQAAISKMPQTQKEAVKAYTGSSYHSINSSLWNGNPSGQAQSAAQALHTLGHDIDPGTVLSRKISLHGADLQQLLNSKGKVLQEPAIMSTSIRPSCWSGNVHLKLHVGPGVKGLWAGSGSMPGGGALSNHSGEDEIILPPNTRLMIIGVKSGGSGDADGFGAGSSHVVEAVILPSEGY